MKKLVRLWKRPCVGGRGFMYVLIWYDENGKERWQSLRHTDAKKAERQRVQKEKEFRMGFVEPGPASLSEMLADYLDKTRGQVAPSTIGESERGMKQFTKVVGNMKIEAVNLRHIETFLQHCLAKGNCPATVNKKLRHLHRVFELAKRRQYLEGNPFQDIKQLKVTDKEIQTFSDAEVELLLQAAPNVIWRGRILVARCAGLRVGEIMNLTWDDIDLHDYTVKVQAKDDTVLTWAWHPKDYERRLLPLSEEAVQTLLQIRTECPESQPYPLIRPLTYLKMLQRRDQGIMTYDNRRLPETAYSNEFKKIRTLAGLSRRTMHDLRRSAITAWAENPNLQPHEVMKLAGHSSLQTTLKYYVQFKRSMVDRARASHGGADDSKIIADSLQLAI